MINAKSEDQDLMWEVVKWWTNGENGAYWADNSGTYPARVDAAEKGYGKNAAPQLAEALPLYEKHAVGLEDFPQWADVENQAEAQIRDCFAGKMSVKEAIDAVEKIVIDAVGL
jgi:ABC-type glycerol-3-phosphate transport system substrate-binding protein